MSVEHVEARAGAYADSVTLMQVSAHARKTDGVEAALVSMATELNLGLLPGMGFSSPPRAGANDLLIAVRARDAAALAGALATVDAALTARPQGEGTAATEAHRTTVLPRTTGAAVRDGGPGLALISVPGAFAFAEAMDALQGGCDVMIFSDNVPVEQEVALKEFAGERGLLVMGPDCGTAIVGGIGLGFSHSLPAGPVGMVAASGTGAQQVLCLLAQAGAGVSAALGVGGRDLSAAVGGRSARAALAALDEDPATELIVVVSKPPAPEVAAALREYAAALSTPAVLAFTEPGQPDLTAVAEHVLRTAGLPVPHWPSWMPDATRRARAVPARGATPGAPAVLARGATPGAPAVLARGATPGAPAVLARGATPGAPAVLARGATPGAPAVLARGATPGPPAGAGALRGLFAGGTLCEEAMVIASETLGPVWSNIPLRPEWKLAEPLTGTPPGHAMIDFGDDELTVGRAHPMIDQALRLDRLAAAAADPDVAVIQLDVVLGHGAHPDPAAELAPLIADAPQPVVVSLIGAPSDPQGLPEQAETLRSAGAYVFASNAAATRFACSLVGVTG
jgi:FdrA protein